MSTLQKHVQLAESTMQRPHPGRRLSEEEFIAWCGDDTWAEWVDGEVIVMSPVNLRGYKVMKLLLKVMDDFVEAHGAGIILGEPVQVRLRKDRRRSPDIFFVTQQRLELLQPNHVEGSPDLIVEVVSPESAERDWRDKFADYESAGVREYWVIDPATNHMQAYCLNIEGKYEVIAESQGRVESGVLPGFYLRPHWLWQDPLPRAKDLLRELGVE